MKKLFMVTLFTSIMIVNTNSALAAVTLFEHINYEGRSETFTHDDPDLRDNIIGNDILSSINIPNGCAVVLYEAINYEGKSGIFTSDDPDLRDNYIGNDTVSSIKVVCDFSTAKFDITIDAANKLISTAYYSDRFTTNFSGSHTASTAFEIGVTMDQPTQDNVNIYEGNLYVDLLWRVSGGYTIDDRDVSFDKSVPIRLGLKKEEHLKFVAAQIQILDQSIPLPFQGIIKKEIDQKLLQVEDFLVTKANIINALPTQTLNLQTSTFDYDFWIDRPIVETVEDFCIPLGIIYFCDYDLLFRIGLHARINADFLDFGRLNERYDIVMTPRAHIDYGITDTQIDAVMKNISDFISKLPAKIRDEVEQAMLNLKIPLYQGRLIDIVNERLPKQIDVKLSDAAASARVLKDRIRLTADINAEGKPPEFTFVIPGGRPPIPIKIFSNVTFAIKKLVIVDLLGNEIRNLTPSEIDYRYEHKIPWDGKNNSGQYVAAGRYIVLAVVDNNFNLQLLKSWRFNLVK